MADFNTYKDAFPHAKLGRSPEGVIEVVLHANGSTMIFNGYTHEEFVDLFHAVGCDSANRVVILTGTGDAVMEEIAPEGFDFFTPASYDKIYREGKKSPDEHPRHQGAADRRGERPGAAALRIYPARRHSVGRPLDRFSG